MTEEELTAEHTEKDSRTFILVLTAGGLCLAVAVVLTVLLRRRRRLQRARPRTSGCSVGTYPQNVTTDEMPADSLLTWLRLLALGTVDKSNKGAELRSSIGPRESGPSMVNCTGLCGEEVSFTLLEQDPQEALCLSLRHEQAALAGEIGILVVDEETTSHASSQESMQETGSENVET